MSSAEGLWLAVDTSTHLGSVALWRSGAVLAERTLDTPVAGPGLLGELEAVLSAGGVTLGQVDAFAVGLGPGAFTSLRVGLATVKGLAYALGRGVVGAGSLHALAARALRLGVGVGGAVAAVLDARRGEVYGAVYDGRLAVLLDERARSPEAFGAEVRALGASVTGVGAGAAAFAERLGFPCVEDTRLQAPHAAEVAALAASLAPAALLRGAALAALAPRYIRPADAELNPRFPPPRA